MVNMKINGLQRDETSNTSTPTKLLPIDQIISHIASVPLDSRQQSVQTPDNQAGVPTGTGDSGASAEVSRRSSTSTQNTDTLTPVNLPCDNLENPDVVQSLMSTSDSNLLLHDGNAIGSPCEEFPLDSQEASQNTVVSQSSQSELPHQDGTAREDADSPETSANVSQETEFQDANRDSAEASAPIEPAKPAAAPPIRKISRFLVSPVVEKKLLSGESECHAPSESAESSLARQDSEAISEYQQLRDGSSQSEGVQQSQVSQGLQNVTQVQMGVAQLQQLLGQIQPMSGAPPNKETVVMTQQPQQPQIVQNIQQNVSQV